MPTVLEKHINLAEVYTESCLSTPDLDFEKSQTGYSLPRKVQNTTPDYPTFQSSTPDIWGYGVFHTSLQFRNLGNTD